MIQSSRNDNKLAVILIDLDHFKTINDSLGHEIGDLLLKEVTARLLDCVRNEDTVARQGGMSFLLCSIPLRRLQTQEKLRKKS